MPYPSLTNDSQVERAVERGARPASWGGDAAAVGVASVSSATPVTPLPVFDTRADPPELPSTLRTLVGECWATDPMLRPRSAADVLGRLTEILPVAMTSLSDAAGGTGGAATPVATLAPSLASWRPSFILPDACPVCADDGPSLPGVRTGCGVSIGSVPHSLCLSCALRHVRAELIPGARTVRCPQCIVDRSAGALTVAAVAEIAAWSRLAGRPDATGPLRPLSDDELARHSAMVAAESRRAVEEALPAGLFKRCPSCGTGVIRARGHHCHHISPGTGCLNCHAHFCYACLHLYHPGENVHRCPTGCQLFCWPGCDCPDCTECRTG